MHTDPVTRDAENQRLNNQQAGYHYEDGSDRHPDTGL